MDLDIMASVQEQIIGNCLCVLGDAMAMPIGSMVEKFRDEFEAHIEAARARNDALVGDERAARAACCPGSGRLAMPRPEQRMVTFSIDGREVSAPENTMLVDAAKYGDVEIPVFCYEPKLGAAGRRLPHVPRRDRGHPEAADRVLDAGQGRHGRPHPDRRACSEAQEAVVEFLLINHPLDCPVCDKGGECPLQDISFGWGGGRSRFIEPKRHFDKPLELSPLDRDRPRALHPLLPLRALLARRSPRTTSSSCRSAARTRYVGDVRRPPVRRAVQRQHHRAVPGGRADLAALPLPRAPVGHRGRGLGLHAVPVAVQRQLHRPRRARPARARPATTTSVDDGWLCDKGRFAYQSIHVDERITQPLVRDGGELRPVGWERALDEAAAALQRARAGASARSPAATTTNEEGFLLAAPHARGARLAATSTRAPAARCRASCSARSPRPALQATVPDLEFAHAVLVLDCEPVDDAPILDLRIRKGVRRNGVQARGRDEPPVVAGPQRRAGRALRARRRRGVRRRAGRRAGRRRRRRRAGRRGGRRRATRSARSPSCCAAPARTSSILWGERLTPAPRRRRRPRAAERRRRLEPRAAATAPACSRSRPAQRPRAARGRRPARRRARAAPTPTAGPRRRRDRRGAAARRAHRALPAARRPAARRCPTARRGSAALDARHDRRRPRRVPHRRRCASTPTSSSRPSPTPRRRARSRTPTAACSACARRSAARATSAPSGRSSPSSAARLGLDLRRAHRRRWPRRSSSRPCPFYAGLTLDEIGGRGVRWPERDAAAAPAPDGRRSAPFDARGARAGADGQRRACGWAPSARSGRRPRSRSRRRCSSCTPRQRVELSPADAQRLGVCARRARRGRRATATPCAATVAAARGDPAGHASFLGDGVAEDAATRCSTSRASWRCARVSLPLADVGYYEPWWIQIIKALVIFAVGLQLVPVVLLAERKLLGRFQGRYGPNRVGPFGVAAAAGRHPQAARPRSSSARARRSASLFVLAPVISILTAVAALRDHPVRRRRRHLRHAGRPLRHRRRRSARCTSSRSARSPSTGSCSAAGRRARSTRSWARCAPPRS